MKILVRLKPQARQDSVEKTGDNQFLVRVKAKAMEGKANRAAIKLLSEYFNKPQSSIVILKGEKCRTKVFAIS